MKRSLVKIVLCIIALGVGVVLINVGIQLFNSFMSGKKLYAEAEKAMPIAYELSHILNEYVVMHGNVPQSTVEFQGYCRNKTNNIFDKHSIEVNTNRFPLVLIVNRKYSIGIATNGPPILISDNNSFLDGSVGVPPNSVLNPITISVGSNNSSDGK